ncbi:MAG: helix-turn-helix domain-containing protein [Actinomycetota bacterium]|nr:helix-turn-helix domain-containing protein [Actinomycetota bacterium]
MSVEAISWALNLAPVPADRNGQPSSPCKFVLVGLANHAGPDGTAAFPSVRTLMRYTGLAERTVRACLARLEAAGVISPCDPAIIAARIRRADRRPRGWDLNLARIRSDLSEAEIGVLERQFPGLAARLAAAQADDQADRFGTPEDGVHALHPAPLVDNPADGVQEKHPVQGTGCSRHPDGVQPAPPRGAPHAPEPYIEPNPEPPAAARPRETPAVTTARSGPPGGGGQASDFFAALGPAWPLTVAQQARLTPAVTAALDAGWTPGALAACTGSNVNGIRNPYAVLARRLSPAELPDPPGRRSRRPAWCGECDQATRMLGFDTDTPRRCPRCKRAGDDRLPNPARTPAACMPTPAWALPRISGA